MELLIDSLLQKLIRLALRLKTPVRVCALVSFLFSGVLCSRGDVAKGYDLKAVFLLNFAEFVDWPPSAFAQPDSPLVIGILGEDPFGKSLNKAIGNEVVGNHHLVVKRYKTVSEIGSCHVLFISQSDADQLKEIIAALKNKPVLTVSEAEGFMTTGGMIQFLTKDNKVRFRINNNAIKSAGLSISSKLLKVADEVVGKVTP